MPLNTHEEFRQLCALATSGCLTDEEQEQLETHLVQCDGCRRALREYDRVARIGMPSLAENFPEGLADDADGWSEEAACQEFFERLDSARRGGSAGLDRQYGLAVRGIGLQSPRVKVRMPFAARALPYAAAIFLATGVGWFGYRVGMERAASVARVVSQTPLVRAGSTADVATLSAANIFKERESVGAQVEKRDREIALLTDKVARQTAEVAKLRQEQKDLSDSLQKTQTERDQKVSEREALGHNLDQSQAELARVKNDLDALQKQRSGDAAREAEVE